MKPTPCPMKESERQQLASLTKKFLKDGGRINSQPIQVRSASATAGFNNSKPKPGKKAEKKYTWHDEITQIIGNIKARKKHAK